MRNFETGATRDDDTDKLDFEGFLHPDVLYCYAEYMHKNRKQADGNLRDSDNWQKGIEAKVYMKSAFRHFMDWWRSHRKNGSLTLRKEAICGLIFNAMGYLLEIIRKEEQEEMTVWYDPKLPPPQLSVSCYSRAIPVMTDHRQSSSDPLYGRP